MNSSIKKHLEEIREITLKINSEISGPPDESLSCLLDKIAEDHLLNKQTEVDDNLYITYDYLGDFKIMIEKCQDGNIFLSLEEYDQGIIMKDSLSLDSLVTLLFMLFKKLNTERDKQIDALGTISRLKDEIYKKENV